MTSNASQDSESKPSAKLPLLARIVRFLSRRLVVPYKKSIRWISRDESNIEKVEDPSKGILVCTWHGSNITIMGAGDHRLVALVSPHWIGELLAQFLQALGYRAIRTSRFFNPLAGTRAIQRALARGERVAITLDGPIGPRRQIHSNVVKIASRSGSPMVPGFAVARPSIRFPTWDRNEWPIPFARAATRYAEPIYVPPDITREQEKEYEERLTKALNDMEAELEIIARNGKPKEVSNS